MNNKFKLATPPMGWNSYCTCDCDPSEEIMLSAADLLIDLGLAEVGYNYVNLDDGWLKPERDANGRLQHRDDIFPRGMNFLTDYIHSKGLKAGTYLGAGLTTWHGDAGSLMHEFEDAKSCAEWGFDYIKYDRHPSEDDPCKDTVANYVRMGLAIKECGRDIIYNLCEHGTTDPWMWAQPVGQLWRTGKDIRDNWKYSENPEGGLGIIDMIDMVVCEAAKYGHKGGFNDPDFLIVGCGKQNEWMGGGCTIEEYRSVMAIWSMLSAPLLIGADLRNFAAGKNLDGLEVLKNRGMIAIDQDPLSIPARRIIHDPLKYDLWFKPMNDFKWAVALVNRSAAAMDIGFTFEEIGLSAELPVKLTNAWNGETVADKVKGEYSTNVARHDTAVFIIEPSF